MTTDATLFVVDDDSAILDALRAAGKYLGLTVETYDSAEQFLQVVDPSRDGCLLLDVKMPGMGGLALQRALNERNSLVPIIMISGHGDVPTAVNAMQQGAVTFVEKPFGLTEIRGYITQALETAALWKARCQRHQAARDRLGRLTEPQRTVLDLMSRGLSNRQIAGQLGLSLRAVEDRKSRLIHALQVESLAELFVLASLANNDPSESQMQGSQLVSRG